MSDLADALATIGLSPRAGRLYAALLEHGPGRLASVTADWPDDRRDVSRAYDELVTAGLAAPARGARQERRALPPTDCVERLRRRRVDELDAARSTVQQAFDDYRRRHPSERDGDVVDVVTGEAVRVRLEQAVQGARARVRRLDVPPYADLDVRVGLVREAAARGVAQRTVYSQASLRHPGYYEDVVEACVEAGEDARVGPHVPVRLVLVDDTLGLVSAQVEDGAGQPSLVVVRPSSLLSALEGLFELAWQHALPVSGPEARAAGLRTGERQLLTHLAAGVTDDQIAARLGISRRTLSRRIEMLMVRTGSATRFQLAMHAHRRGWL
ncbi:MAG: LuxR family transcriptional regulator [Aeromicrobium erythreum]